MQLNQFKRVEHTRLGRGRSRQPTDLAKTKAALVADDDVVKQLDSEDFARLCNALG
jgi:hypothetical protein